MLEIRKQQNIGNPWSKASYENIYAGEGIQQTDSFYAWLLKLMRLKPEGNMLDVSCGKGRLVDLARADGLSSYGVDFSEQSIRIAKDRSTHGGYVVADAQALPFPPNSFDLVSNIGSLEHYVDPAKGASEIARILKADGLACILLPNLYSLLDNVWYAFRYGRTAQDNQPIQRYASRYEWQDLLEASGLFVQRTIKYQREFPTRWADLLYYLRKPKMLARMLSTPFVPLNLASCFVFLCRKKGDTGVH